MYKCSCFVCLSIIRHFKYNCAIISIALTLNKISENCYVLSPRWQVTLHSSEVGSIDELYTLSSFRFYFGNTLPWPNLQPYGKSTESSRSSCSHSKSISISGSRSKNKDKDNILLFVYVCFSHFTCVFISCSCCFFVYVCLSLCVSLFYASY